MTKALDRAEKQAFLPCQPVKHQGKAKDKNAKGHTPPTVLNAVVVLDHVRLYPGEGHRYGHQDRFKYVDHFRDCLKKLWRLPSCFMKASYRSLEIQVSKPSHQPSEVPTMQNDINMTTIRAITDQPPTVPALFFLMNHTINAANMTKPRSIIKTSPCLHA